MATIKDLLTKMIIEINDVPSTATDEDVVDLLSEINAVTPVTTLDGSILTSNTDEIYSL